MRRVFTVSTRSTVLVALILGACSTPPAAHELPAQQQSATRTVSTADAPGPSPSQASKAAKAKTAAGAVAGDNSEISPGELPVSRSRFPAPARLVALGDLHGDLQATRKALRLAGAIDEQDHWIGADLVVVQTGDQLDRGDDEQAILELLAKLEHEAAAAGGAVHVLNGNHEFMNALGDLRYVTPGGFADFEDAPGADPADPALAAVMDQVPEQARARVAAFLPGRPWARELGKRNTIVVVGDSVFVHGGLLPSYADRIDTINADARAFLNGDQPEPPAAITDSEGPVWTRRYSDRPDAEACGLLHQALDTIGAKRMVVGHTVHTEGIQSACDGQVWMIDVGLADYYDGPTQVLEIRGDAVTVLKG